VEEEAKAVQEVAKTLGKIVDGLAHFFGDPLNEVSGILTDKLRFHRTVNLLRLQERFEEILRERGITRPTRQLRLSFGIPLLEAGALEDDDSLQDLWAALLANSVDASVNIEPRTAFISILKSFSPFDAKVMSRFGSVT
jgi:hypothetical protein